MLSQDISVKTFRLAPMSPLISTLTTLLMALPVGFAIAAVSGVESLTLPAVLVFALYVWVWMRFRPSQFNVREDGLEVIWPLKRRHIPRDEITNVRIVNAPDLKKEIGWGMRIGAGGLWGGFGWLKTKHRGIVQMYVSRTDRFVWIERAHGKPWLITPEEPEAFVAALRANA